MLRNLLYSQFIAAFFPQYAAPAKLEAFDNQSADDLSKFDGYYSDLRISILISSLQNKGESGLTISDTFIGPRELYQVDENLFVDKLTNQFTAFKLDEDGKVLYMKEPYINPMGYASKGVDPAGFADVTESHEYAEYIYALQSLGIYSNNSTERFYPEKAVTRAEYIQHILEVSNIRATDTAEPAFTDLEGHPAAGYIQTAYELGMVNGNGSGLFEPDRIITRQEAAVMLWRIYKQQYPDQLFTDVKVAGDTSAWAVQAVQMMTSLGIHGPEVTVEADGSVDFASKEVLTKQEEATIIYMLFTQPTDIIVRELSAKSEASADAA
ncbi:S-layer protein precursor [compost metagenome]